MLQVVVGGLMFLVVFFVATGIGAIVKAAERFGMAPGWLVAGTDYIEIGVWVIDAMLYALFILVEAVKFTRTILGGLRD